MMKNSPYQSLLYKSPGSDTIVPQPYQLPRSAQVNVELGTVAGAHLQTVNREETKDESLLTYVKLSQHENRCQTPRSLCWI